MSLLTYNGIQIALTRIAAFTQEAVRSEDGSDYLYTKFRLTVEGVLNPLATSYLSDSGGAPSPGPGVLPPDTNKAIRHTLMQPRRQLIFQELGRSILFSPRVGNDTDANNGPFPVSLDIVKVTGVRTWTVRFAIETCLVECPSAPDYPILSNRFSQSVDIDTNFLSVVRTSGVTVFASDLLASSDGAKFGADYFRPFIFSYVRERSGFKRSPIRVALSPDGLTLRWEITDVEQQFDLGDTGPDGSGTFVTDVKGTYRVDSALSPDGNPGGVTTSVISLTVTGSKQASTFTLLLVALGLAARKMPLYDPNQGYVRSISCVQDVWDRRVTLTVTANLNPKNQSVFLGIDSDGLRTDNIFTDENGAPLVGNPSPPGGEGSRGTALNGKLIAFAVALGTSCSTSVSEDEDEGEDETISPPPPPAPPIETEPVPYERIPPQNNNYSESSEQSFYSYEKFTTHYYKQSGKVQARVAGGPNDACEILTLFSPVSQKKVVWTVERYGEVPDLPDPYSNDDNWTLIDTEMATDGPVILHDGEHLVYQISGVYYYAAGKATGAGDEVNFDRHPSIGYKYGDDNMKIKGRTPSDGTTGSPGSTGGDVTLDDPDWNYKHGLIDPDEETSLA